MKKILLVAFLFMFTFSFAQKNKPSFEKVGDKVKVTYFYEDGTIHKTGFFKDQKVTGKWTQFDRKGNTIKIEIYSGNELQSVISSKYSGDSLIEEIHEYYEGEDYPVRTELLEYEYEFQ